MTFHVSNLAVHICGPLDGLENQDWTGLFLGGLLIFWEGGRGAVVLLFLVCETIAYSTFPQQAIFFPLGGRE